MEVLCDPCLHTWRDGHNSRVPAAYLWTTGVGNLVALCIACCAGWRQNAAGDPELAPLRIEQISQPA